MNYEKKYKEALSWMRSLYNGLHGSTKEDAEHYFPELKESDDERIRKHLIDCVTHTIPEASAFKDIKKEDILAWLEKQGEQKTINADEVIAWFVANIIDYEDMVKLFKKDFEL